MCLLEAPSTHLCATIRSSDLVQKESSLFPLSETPAPTQCQASECNTEALMHFVPNMTLKEMSGVCKFILGSVRVAGRLPHALQLHPKYAIDICTQGRVGRSPQLVL